MPNDYVMINNTTDNRWDLAYTVDTSGTKAKILSTSGTYVDKDIKVSVVTPAASSVSLSGTNTVTPSLTGANSTLVTTNNSGISITGGGSAAVPAVVSVGTAGFVASGILTSSTLSGSNTTTKYLKEVEITQPSTGSREFGVKVPNGASTVTFVFHVDASGNVVVNNTYSLTY